MAGSSKVCPLVPQVKVQRAGNDESDRVEVEKRLLAARKEKGDLRIVSGRGLQKGDVALIDFTARRTDSQEQIVGTEREGLHIDTGEPENSIGIPGPRLLQNPGGMKLLRCLCAVCHDRCFAASKD